MKNFLIIVFLTAGLIPLYGQETNFSNPLNRYIGEWKVVSKSTAEHPNPKTLFYSKATKMEAGYGINLTSYRVLEDNSKEPFVTINWVYHPQSESVYAYKGITDIHVKIGVKDYLN